MNNDDLIDDVMQYVYNISAADADNTDRRARVLQYYQDTVDEVWLVREWPFSFKEATVAIGSDGSGTLPTDYLELGSLGGVYDTNGVKLEEIPFPALKSKLIRGQTQAPPREFAIFSNGAAMKIRTLGSNTNVYFQYRTTPITVTDAAAAPTPIPEGHHNSVLLAGTAAKAAHSIGDPRQEWEQSFQAGLRRMMLTERPRKTSIQKMPRAISMW